MKDYKAFMENKLSNEVSQSLRKMKIQQVKQDLKKKSYLKKAIDVLAETFTDKLIQEKEKDEVMKYKLRRDLLD